MPRGIYALLFAATAFALSFTSASCDEDNGRGDITVFAAASLTEAFEEAGAAFEDQHETDVTFNFAGSPALRTQIAEGANAEVYAPADEENMVAALESGLVREPAGTFARNKLVIIVPADNPANIRLLPDIATPGLRMVVAAPEVPVGRYTRQVIDTIDEDGGFAPGFRDTVLANVISEEPSVKAVVAKVQLGEADLGFVYASDVTPEIEDDVAVVEIPLDYNVEASYPIALTAGADNPEGAQAFVDFILSDEGQDILEKHGFQRAP